MGRHPGVLGQLLGGIGGPAIVVEDHDAAGRDAVEEAVEGRDLRFGGVEVDMQEGDALEAQAFAYLAVRSLRGMPLSLPTTTWVSRPLTGGRLHRVATG